ncbi:hypothetical protein, partial [Gallibacterium genomosp. 3]|uniref:hypothetical protein n=1 Tax=Gallibacterium genomosp. 3 TaxID=505345 RepID=UPI001ADF37F0
FDVPCFFIFVLWQNGQFFVHISKRVLKALYYKALSLLLATNLSITPILIVSCPYHSNGNLLSVKIVKV